MMRRYIHRHRRTLTRRQRAFTLIEMVVVVALLAVLLSIAVPPFFRGLGWARMSGTARALVTMAKFARFHAIMHGRPVFLVVDIEGGRFSVESEPPAGVAFAWPEEMGSAGAWEDDGGAGAMDMLGAEMWGAGDGWGDDGDVDAFAEDDGGVDGFRSALASIQPYEVPSQLRIDTFLFAESERLDADKAAVGFLPDGTCQEFSLLLEDPRGRKLEVWFDPLTGQPEVYTPRESS
jgi:prepilin-type N-terminal cleavage/methylation domain-containing protein